MRIIVPEPPVEALPALRTLDGVLARSGPAAAVPAAAAATRTAGRPVTPEVSAPVYVLGLGDVVGGGGLPGAELAVWTHVLPVSPDEDAGVAAADVDARTWRLASVTEGPPIAGLRRQVRELTADGSAAGGGGDTYQLAVLRVPALHVSAVWLRGTGDAGDVLVPLPGPGSPLEAGRHYSTGEFLDALREPATRALAQTSDTSGG